MSVPLDRFLRDHLNGASWNQCRQLITRGRVSVNGDTTMTPTTLVAPGVEVALDVTKRTPRKASSACVVVYVDSQLVVVDKPPGISTVPFGDEERDSLWHRVRASLTHRQSSAARGQLLVVHRIDKETSGLVVFARTHASWKYLKQLFRVHAIERRYVALVHGRISERTLRSRLVADRGDGRRGSTRNPRLGREAVTHVRPLEGFPKATLVECQLETGRTHQIRIQLSEAGFPLLGERVYTTSGVVPIVVPRVMLHARDLGFAHPTTGEPCNWSLPMPGDMVTVVQSLRLAK